MRVPLRVSERALETERGTERMRERQEGGSVKSLRAWDIVALLCGIPILVLRVTDTVQIVHEVYRG